MLIGDGFREGIGNGVSLIIMAGIVAQFPSFVSNMFEGGRTGAISAHPRESARSSPPGQAVCADE